MVTDPGCRTQHFSCRLPQCLPFYRKPHRSNHKHELNDTTGFHFGTNVIMTATTTYALPPSSNQTPRFTPPLPPLSQTFGSTATSGGFGTTTSAFGAKPSVFGAPAAAPTTTFGAAAPAATSAFGRTASTPFGAAPATGAFGAPAAAPASPFGVAAAPAAGLGGFGSTTGTTSAFGKPASSPFGAPAPAATGSVFGAPAPAAGGFGGFGAPAPAATGLFGAAAPAPGAGAFGAPAPAPAAGGLFGAAPAATRFGAGAAKFGAAAQQGGTGNPAWRETRAEDPAGKAGSNPGMLMSISAMKVRRGVLWRLAVICYLFSPGVDDTVVYTLVSVRIFLCDCSDGLFFISAGLSPGDY